MSNEQQFDQTWFAEESVFVDKQDPGAEVPFSQPNRSKLLLLAGGGILAALVLGGLLLALIWRPDSTPPLVPPATVNEDPVAIGPLERQLLILQKDIEMADPLTSALAFPPVNFSLALEDATVLQQQQR